MNHTAMSYHYEVGIPVIISHRFDRGQFAIVDHDRAIRIILLSGWYLCRHVGHETTLAVPSCAAATSMYSTDILKAARSRTALPTGMIYGNLQE